MLAFGLTGPVVVDLGSGLPWWAKAANTSWSRINEWLVVGGDEQVLTVEVRMEWANH